MPREGNGGVWQQTSNCAELYDSSKVKCGTVYLENMSKGGSSGLWGDDRRMLEEYLNGILQTQSPWQSASSVK